jgi:hypothetical protein
MNAAEKLLTSDKFFYCRKYEATISKKSCKLRQKYARMRAPKKKFNGHHNIIIRPVVYAGCRDCEQGKRK